MRKRIFIFAMALYVIAACKTYDTSKTNKDFRIIEATSLLWYGGVEGSGFGIQYLVSAVITTGKTLAFDTIWVDQRAFLPFVTHATKPEASSFSKGDTIFLTFEYRKVGEAGFADGTITETPPKSEGPKFTGDGLIIYRLEGEQRIKSIPAINSLEPQYYP